MKGRRARRGQFIILTAVTLVISILLITTVLNTAIISRTEYFETNFREITQKISTDSPKALSSALANASLTFKARGSLTEALTDAEIYLANWRENVMNTYAGLGVKLDISDPVNRDLIELAWEDNSGSSSIAANFKLDLTTIGFSGWNDTRTVELDAQVTPESVRVTPSKLTFNMTLFRENNKPVVSLTNDLLEIKAHYIGAQIAFQTLNSSTATLRYFGNGLYNITIQTGNTGALIDAFQLFVYDDSGIVVGLTVDLTTPPDVIVVKSVKLNEYSDKTVATVKVVSILNQPIRGATIFGHWEGNVTDTDRVPVILTTDSNGQAVFTAAHSSLFQTNGSRNSNVGEIDFKIDDVSFSPVILVVAPTTATSVSGWSNPSNAKADGGGSASASTSGSRATFTGYNFNMIPSSAKIMNVWLRLDAWQSGSGSTYIRSKISSDGGLTFPLYVDEYTSSAASEPLPSDTYPLWIPLNSTAPLGWNITQLQSANFFFDLTKYGSNTVSLDFIPIVVLYQPNYKYEPLRSITQATAVKRCASGFSGTWTNAINALRNDTVYAYASADIPTTMTLRPNVNGTYQQWTSFGSGNNHWSLTSDQNDNTGVQIKGNTTAKETENLQDTTQTGIINSVTEYMRAKESGQTLEYDTVTFDAASSQTSAISVISYSTGTKGRGTGSSSSGSAITINSGDFVLAHITIVGTSTTVSSLTLGTGNTMTLLDGPRDYSTNVRSYLYYYSASSSLGSVTPTLTLSGSANHAWTLSVYTGCATSPPYFENVNYATGSGSSPVTASVTISSGTTGRLVVSGTAIADTSNGAYTITIAPAGSPVETERQEQDQVGTSSTRGVSSQLEDYASDTSRTNSAVGTASGRTLAWVEHGVAILPARSMSWTHTTGTSSNRLLLVSIGTFGTSGTPATVSSITYGGVALTLVASDIFSTNPQVRSYLYRLTNPASGSNTISVTFSASTLAVGGSVSYFNVNQTTPIQSSTNIGSGTAQSVSLTPTGNYNMLFYASMMSYRTASPSSYTVTEGSGQTNRWNQIGLTYKGRGSEKTVTGGALQTMSWTTSSTASWVAVGAIIVPTKTTNPVEQAVILWRTHNADYQSSVFTISRTAFTNYTQTLTTNPNTGQPWTWAEVNALQIGAIASTLGTSETIQVSEFWIVVNFNQPPAETFYGFGFNIPSEAIIDYLDIQSDLWLPSSGNDYVNISLSRDSGVNWIPTQPFGVNPLTSSARTYHINSTGWYRWTFNDLNGNGLQARIIKVTAGSAEQVNLDYLAMYTQYHIRPTLSPPFMHVDSITLAQQGTSPKSLTSNVKIADEQLGAIRSAGVTVTIRDNNGTTWTRSANTASNGIATFTLSGVTTGHTYTLTVNSVTKTDWIYDSGSNYESSKAYIVT